MSQNINLFAKISKNEFRLGRTQEQLRNRQLPLDLRMKALLIIQNRPTRYTENLLREALGDPFEDLRLLAYGILASKEKQISQRIHDVLNTLNLAIEQTQTEAAYIATRELAELYWELTYQNLVQGGMRAYALEQVQHYAAQALPLAGIRHRVTDVGRTCLPIGRQSGASRISIQGSD